MALRTFRFLELQCTQCSSFSSKLTRVLLSDTVRGVVVRETPVEASYDRAQTASWQLQQIYFLYSQIVSIPSTNFSNFEVALGMVKGAQL